MKVKITREQLDDYIEKTTAHRNMTEQEFNDALEEMHTYFSNLSSTEVGQIQKELNEERLKYLKLKGVYNVVCELVEEGLFDAASKVIKKYKGDLNANE